MKITMNTPVWSCTEKTNKETAKRERHYVIDATKEPVELDIPDHLVDKTIGVIDELFQRTWDDLENISLETRIVTWVMNGI